MGVVDSIKEKERTKQFKYLIRGKDGDYLSTLYRDSTSDTKDTDVAMKLETEEEARLMASLAGRLSENFKGARILVLESCTYYLDLDIAPVVNL